MVLETSYDDLGRKLRTSHHDYLTDGTQVSEWHELKYDEWNQESSRLYSNGQEVFNQYDPIAQTRTEWEGKASDKHCKVTTYNADGTVAKTEWKGSDGAVYQTQAATYTHAGQVAKLETEGVHGVITIDCTYDGFGRLLSEQYEEKGKDAETEALNYTYHYSYPAHWLISEAEQVDIEFDGIRRTLGLRTFDSWGRITSLTRGASTEEYTYEGATQVPASKKTAEGKTLNYEYIKELGNRLSKVSEEGGIGQKTFTYAHGMNGESSAGEGERLLEYNHDVNDRLIAQRIQTQPAAPSETAFSYSRGGRLLSETDVQGNITSYNYNTLGQRDSTICGDLSTRHFYDSQGRLDEEVITQTYNSAEASVTVSYSYDAQHRETSRSFSMDGMIGLKLTRSYYADNSLKSIELKESDAILGLRSFTYTEGGRLASCTTTGLWRPKNPNNKDVDSQVFTYDALGNVTTCVTTFGEEVCTSTYIYDSASGCRLEKVEHDHEDYTTSATLSYDAAGRVTRDQTGKTYAYDWLGRLTQAGSSRYAYDPMDRLMTHGQNDEQRQIIYNGLQVRGEYHPADPDTARHLRPGSAACTVQKVKRSGVERILFELRDVEGTVLVTYDVQAETMKHHAYTAYGEHFSEETDSLLGFNGEYRDAENDQYPLGQGYRWYAPDGMQFHVQDTLSPFGDGGPQAYGYCNGNPVNFQDRSGHIGAGKVRRGLRRIWGDNLPQPASLGRHGALISTVLWSVIGVMTAVMTGGTSLLLTAALFVLAVASAATAITSVVIADSNPEAAAILGWVSLGLTLVGGLATIGRKVGQLAVRLGRSGVVLARNIHHKMAVAVEHRLSGWRSFKAHKIAYRNSDPRNGDSTVMRLHGVNEPYEFNQVFTSIEVAAPEMHYMPKAMAQNGVMAQLWSKSLGAFDAADVNTVVCAVTGVLGNAGYYESDRAAYVSGNVNNATWLPWGSFNVGRYH